MLINAVLGYAIALAMSTGKKSFEGIGRFIKKSGDTVKRMLAPSEVVMQSSQKIAKVMLSSAKTLYLMVDDSLIKKIHSEKMVGVGWFYDTKIGRKIKAYRLIAAMIGDGRYVIPIAFGFMFDKDLLDALDEKKDKLDFIKEFFRVAKTLFPDAEIVLLGDGLFSTLAILSWCIENQVKCEMRIHSNRKVTYKGQEIVLNKIESLRPRGRQMGRTISAKWHGLELYFTAQKRIDKHGVESIVFLVSSYQAAPREHISNYKKRWPIEKVFRTGKQSLGLQDCFSTSLETQLSHVACVLLAYALLQWQMKERKYSNPEDAIKALKRKKYHDAISRFSAIDQIFGDVHE